MGDFGSVGFVVYCIVCSFKVGIKADFNRKKCIYVGIT